MYVFYFDCGTSKTRGYLIKNGNIVGINKREIGSKDVSLLKDNTILINAMKYIYDTLLRQHQVIDSDISFIYASGMITSPYGLFEIPHVVVPVDKKRMKEFIYEYYEGSAFQRSIYLIPGLKTSDKKGTFENIESINNVRGEEIEVMGICNYVPREWKTSKYVVVIPGSHTHSILMENETIIDIYSAFSGELFHAVTSATILSGSTTLDNIVSDTATDTQAIKKGCEYLKNYGLARAIYIVHAMKIFYVEDNKKRRECLSGIINGAVVESLALNIKNLWKDVKGFVIYGDDKMLATYKEAINFFIPHMKDRVLTLDRNEVNCAVDGLLTIINS